MTQINTALIKRSWLYFRTGYATYLVFIVGLSNFLLLLYNFTPFKDYLDFTPFAILVVILLLPLGIIIGRLHFRKQHGTEMIISTDKNPYMYKIVPNSKDVLLVKAMINDLEISKVIINHVIKDNVTLEKYFETANKSIAGLNKLLEGKSSTEILK